MENFDALPYEDKVFSIIKNGVFLNTISLENQMVDLYHLDGIYVELFYHPVTAEVQKISKANGARLHLYSLIVVNETKN